MPLVSKAQQRWMFATHPEMAKRWADETPDMKGLPEHVGDRKRAAHNTGMLNALATKKKRKR